MRMTVIEKPAVVRKNAAATVTTVGSATRRGARAQALAAADQQMAEIERTFSLRWEW